MRRSVNAPAQNEAHRASAIDRGRRANEAIEGRV
jgi:hypothetical protein